MTGDPFVLAASVAIALAAAYAIGRAASSNAAGFAGGILVGFVIILSGFEVADQFGESHAEIAPGEGFWYVVFFPMWAMGGALAVAMGRWRRANQ
jgi:lipopolysaccharide export LptBFGC system permease protein LptF